MTDTETPTTAKVTFTYTVTQDVDASCYDDFTEAGVLRDEEANAVNTVHEAVSNGSGTYDVQVELV